MKFDESKVFTLLNADKVKIRDKGYFADNLSVLKNAVLTEDRELFGEITRILADVAPCRFGIKDNESGYGEYGLFYLVEEPKKEEFRPYQTTDEMVDNFMERFYLLPRIHQLPIIWIKNKDNGQKSFILDYSKTIVTTSTRTMSMEYLFEHYVYLDDSPCGIKED